MREAEFEKLVDLLGEVQRVRASVRFPQRMRESIEETVRKVLGDESIGSIVFTPEQKRVWDSHLAKIPAVNGDREMLIQAQADFSFLQKLGIEPFLMTEKRGE